MDFARFRPSVREPSASAPAFADLKLKWLDTHEVAVHKLALAATMDADVSDTGLEGAEVVLNPVDGLSEEDYIQGVEVLLDFVYRRVTPAADASVGGLLVAAAIADQLQQASLKTVVNAALLAQATSSTDTALALCRRDDLSASLEEAAAKKLAASISNVDVSELGQLRLDRLVSILKAVSDPTAAFSVANQVVDARVVVVQVKLSVSAVIPSGKPWGEKPEAGWRVVLVIDESRRFDSIPNIDSVAALKAGDGGFEVEAGIKPLLDQAELSVGSFKWRFESLRLGTNQASNALGKVVLNLVQASEAAVDEPDTNPCSDAAELGELVQWDKLDTELLRQAGHRNIWKPFADRIVDALANARGGSAVREPPVKVEEPRVAAASLPQSAAPAVSPAVAVEVSGAAACVPVVAAPVERRTKDTVHEYRGGGFKEQTGLLFHLGTGGGRRLYGNPSGEWVRVFGSSSGYGLMETLTGRVRTTFRTKNEQDAYLGVELLREASAEIRGYYLRTSEEAGRRLVSWEAAVSADGVRWETVDVRRDDQTLVLAGEGFFETQLRRANQSWFRLRQTDKNSSGGFNLVLANLELFGVLEMQTHESS